MTTTTRRFPESPRTDPETPLPDHRSWAAIAASRTAPRIGTTAAVGAGTLLSLAPGLLPRTPGAQAVLTALLICCALGFAGVLRFLFGRWDFDGDRRFARYRRPLLVVVALAVTVAAWRAGHWQNDLRAAMGTPAIGPGYWLHCALATALLTGIVIGITKALGWALRKLGLLRGLVLGLVTAAVGYVVLAPAVVGWRQQVYAAANVAMDPALTQPVSHTRSGSAGSAVSWPSLGAQGRKFVSGTPEGPVRVYVGVDSAPDLDSRVALAIRELERSGGLYRSNLVVALPTGSGWIDANAVTGFAERFGGDVAVVGLQYSYAPSWVTFVFGRAEAVRAARALFDAVERRLSAMDRPPRLFVYGQSLGALGGSAIFADDAEQDRRTCAALWAGPPAGDVHRAGATVLANSSDPVVHWSPALLWRAPDLTGVRVDAPIPRWLPVVTFLQTTADLLAALDAPPGHGHRYGTDQGTALGSC
ncbi:putative membrane protein [Nocardia amikacinitolerans]|uniref:alpha/beta-hydrolase family protein n=1 Tax=Nocardia amikacinitolerans TaxID=756689 RepID=UPI000A0408A6|nr:alpha/beta-hydrolase family protein [Nocardia amikacinitolerans]MCP2317099.1 putative membrane protein [Nocardia amikacinitolerans]